MKVLGFNENKVRGLLAEKKVTQEELASAIGVTYTTLNNKLNGRTQFNVNEISKIARFFDKEVAYFFAE